MDIDQHLYIIQVLRSCKSAVCHDGTIIDWLCSESRLNYSAGVYSLQVFLQGGPVGGVICRRQRMIGSAVNRSLTTVQVFAPFRCSFQVAQLVGSFAVDKEFISLQRIKSCMLYSIVSCPYPLSMQALLAVHTHSGGAVKNLHNFE